MSVYNIKKKKKQILMYKEIFKVSITYKQFQSFLSYRLHFPWKFIIKNLGSEQKWNKFTSKIFYNKFPRKM